MNHPSRRRFLSLALGAAAASIIAPAPEACLPWWERARRAGADWQPTPIDASTDLEAFTSFVHGSSVRISCLRRRFDERRIPDRT